MKKFVADRKKIVAEKHPPPFTKLIARGPSSDRQ
jgi:hypothetical protein